MSQTQFSDKTRWCVRAASAGPSRACWTLTLCVNEETERRVAPIVYPFKAPTTRSSGRTEGGVSADPIPLYSKLAKKAPGRFCF